MIPIKIVGEWLINIYIKKYPRHLNLLEIGILNDTYLNSYKFDYEYILKNHVELSTYKLSYCCISYVLKALNILNHIKVLNIDNLNIVEIGGGYGGQAFILLKLAKKINVNIQSYSIFDIKYPSLLQNKYIEYTKLADEFKVKSYDNFNLDKDVKDNFNFLISNYALSEISTHIQDEYFKKILYNVKHGFLLWNFLNKEKLNEKLSKENYCNITFSREECNPDIEKNSIEIKF